MTTVLRLFLSLALVASTLFVLSCDRTAVKDFDSKDSPARTDVKKGIKPQADEQVAVIETADYGRIVIELYPNIAPQMVARFKKLIQEGFYDGTAFHRINAEAGLIQGGDPLSKDNDPENDGTGNSSYPNVDGEFSDVPYERGTVGAARSGASPAFGGRAEVTEAQARNTSNCQFFITLMRVSEFDQDYTVFGRVIEGIGNAEIIMRAPADEVTERPSEKVVITRITLQPRSNYAVAQP